MANDTASFDLKEPAPPEPLLPVDPPSLWWFVLIGLLLVVIVLGGWFHQRQRRARQADPHALRQQAFRDAQTALAGINATTARGAAIQVSLILRRYLAAAVMDPSLYETHEEFIARSDSLKALTEPARDACHTGFAALAAVKYSSQESDQAPAALIDGARGLLETLHRGFQG